MALRVREVKQLDSGFDPAVLVEMLASIRRFTDEELADLGAEPTALRAFIDRWSIDLRRLDL